jgi:hypothetical protein
MRHSELISDIINNIAESEREAIVSSGPEREDVATDQVLPQEEEEEKIEEENIEGTTETETSHEVGEEERADNGNNEEEPLVVPQSGGQPHRSARIASGVRPPGRYVHASFVEKG